MKNSDILFECKNITKTFGGLAAVQDASFKIYEGEVVGLIGPNGAGKTTLFNVMTGVLKANKGQLFFRGDDITKSKAHEISRMGVARTFQLMRAFEEMTVVENVITGGAFGAGKSHIEAEEDGRKYLDFVGLDDYESTSVSNLTPFDRKKVELASALNTDPDLLLLDELVAGLNEAELGDAIDLAKRIRNELGITLFWIEHVMRAIMSVAERIIVLHRGEVIANGPPKEISRDEDVIAAYLGQEYVQE
jgi:branched-chain amino acid transport system ATP-binding protein